MCDVQDALLFGTVAQAAANLEASAAEQAAKPAQEPEQASGPTPFAAAHLKDAHLEQPAAAKEEASEAAAETDEWFYKDPADNIQVRESNLDMRPRLHD